jgi:hypothetical protein
MTTEEAMGEAWAEVSLMRRYGSSAAADRWGVLLAALRDSLTEYSDLLSETDAAAYSGRAEEWLRARFLRWESRGLAQRVGRTRYYRRCVLEHRGNTFAAQEAGKLAVKRAS